MTNKGQIAIGTIISIGATILLSFVGNVVASSRMTDTKIQTVENQIYTANIEAVSRIATLEEAVSSLKTDTTTIKNDIKEILRLLK